MPASLTLNWPAETLWSQIEPHWPGFSVEVLPTLDSTNSTLMERARAGQAWPVLLVAEQQTAGRGRMGRSWVSEQAVGQSLTFSLGVPMDEADLSGLSLVAGCALAQGLDPLQRHDIQLKWPNDLWLQQRKLGGILVEVCILGRQRYAVVGCGINVAPPPVLPPAAAGQASVTPPAWVQQFAPDVFAPEVLLQVAMPLALALKQFAVQGFAPWQTEFARRDALAGQLVRLSDGSEGLASGVNAQGGLLIRQADGQLHEVLSQEVSVRPAGG